MARAPWPSKPFSILAAAREAPHRPALLSASGVWTFHDLARQVEGLLGAVEGLEGPVALVGEAEPQSIALLFALFEAHIPVVLLHPRWPEKERRLFLADCGAREMLDPRELSPRKSHGGTRPNHDPEDPLVIVGTSGSSGRPKGVVLSRRALIAAAQASAQNLGWQEHDRWHASLPLAHVGGLSIFTRCLAARRTAVLATPGSFDPQALTNEVARHRVTLLSLVPAMLRRLLKVPHFPPPALRVVLLGGAAADGELLEQAARRRVPVLTTWGLSEACGQVTTQPLGEAPRPGCGPPLPFMEVRIRKGTVEIRGPQLLSAYLPGGLSPLDAEGWFLTGDAGHLDEEGHLHVHGRRDGVVVSGGENVHPEEVEAALRAHPAVEEACVFALPDPDWGQRVAAAVILRDNVDLTTLREHLNPRLAAYKHPRSLFLWSQLPRTASGKIARRQVMEQALAEHLSAEFTHKHRPERP